VSSKAGEVQGGMKSFQIRWWRQPWSTGWLINPIFSIWMVVLTGWRRPGNGWQNKINGQL